MSALPRCSTRTSCIRCPTTPRFPTTSLPCISSSSTRWVLPRGLNQTPSGVKQNKRETIIGAIIEIQKYHHILYYINENLYPQSEVKSEWLCHTTNTPQPLQTCNPASAAQAVSSSTLQPRDEEDC